MVIRHKVVNHPSNTGGAERALYDALTIEDLTPGEAEWKQKMMRADHSRARFTSVKLPVTGSTVMM